jgi:hypothetical protein
MTKEDLEILGSLIGLALLWAAWPLWLPRWDRYLCRRFWNKNPQAVRNWQFYRDDGLAWDEGFQAPETRIAFTEAVQGAWVAKKQTPQGTLWVRWTALKQLDPRRPKTHALWQTLGEAVLEVQPPQYFVKTLSWRSQRKEVPYAKYRVLSPLMEWAKQVEQDQLALKRE